MREHQKGPQWHFSALSKAELQEALSPENTQAKLPDLHSSLASAASESRKLLFDGCNSIVETTVLCSPKMSFECLR